MGSPTQVSRKEKASPLETRRGEGFPACAPEKRHCGAVKRQALVHKNLGLSSFLVPLYQSLRYLSLEPDKTDYERKPLGNLFFSTASLQHLDHDIPKGLLFGAFIKVPFSGKAFVLFKFPITMEKPAPSQKASLTFMIPGSPSS